MHAKGNEREDSVPPFNNVLEGLVVTNGYAADAWDLQDISLPGAIDGRFSLLGEI